MPRVVFRNSSSPALSRSILREKRQDACTISLSCTHSTACAHARVCVCVCARECEILNPRKTLGTLGLPKTHFLTNLTRSISLLSFPKGSSISTAMLSTPYMTIATKKVARGASLRKRGDKNQQGGGCHGQVLPFGS
jgi:hypothetical protein